MQNFLLFFVIFFQITFVFSSIGDYYCGKKDCYKILNVTKDATKEEIKKSYRGLSKIYHPDKARARGEKDSTEKFKEINQAYDVLNNDELRKSYDEYQENPEKSEMYHYYNWYKARYMPQVDPRIVVSLILLAFSLIQYTVRKTMYETALRYIQNSSKFKTTLNAKCEEAKLNGEKKSKSEIREELLKNVQIEGGYSSPKILDLLIFKLLLAPFHIGKFFYFYIRWFSLFTILKRPYQDSDKEYLTYKNLRIPYKQWNTYMKQEERDYYLSLDLWDSTKFQEYLEDQKQLQSEKYAESAKYKQYRRYLKNKRI